MKVQSEQLRDYIAVVLKSIQEGLAPQNFQLDGSVEFDLAVRNITQGKGGLKIYIVNAEGKQRGEELSRIKFKAKPGNKTPQICISNHQK